MKDKFPEIYKNKIENVKSKIQKHFYYHASNEESRAQKNEEEHREDKKVDKVALINKINSIFTRPDYVYQADVNIMYKNGENYPKKVIGIRDNFLVTFEGEKIHIDDIVDIK